MRARRGTCAPSLRRRWLVGVISVLVIPITQAGSGTSTARPLGDRSECLVVQGLNDRCEDWISSLGHKMYDGFQSDWYPLAASTPMVTTADTLFVSVPVQDPDRPRFDERYDFQTAALDTNGALLWKRNHAGDANAWDVPFSAALGPGDDVVYVTGVKDYPESPSIVNAPCLPPRYEAASAVTLAYDADDGTEKWVSDQANGGTSLDASFAVAASPDGKFVYIAGVRVGAGGTSYPACDYDFVVAALAADTGREVWSKSLDGSATSQSFDRALALAVTPDGTRVVATGEARMAGTGRDFFTVALEAGERTEGEPEPGTVAWVATYDGGLGGGNDRATGLGLASDGSVAFVTGKSFEGAPTNRFESQAYATLAYDMATGDRLWVSRYTGSADGLHLPLGIDVDPTGTRVYVTGASSEENENLQDYATVAYSAPSGEQLWVTTYHPVYDVDQGFDVVTAPDGDRIYVTGQSSPAGMLAEAATVAYDDDGEELWAARFSDGSSFGLHGRAWGRKIAISRDGARLFVLGFGQTASAENIDSPERFPYAPTNQWKVWSYAT